MQRCRKKCICSQKKCA